MKLNLVLAKCVLISGFVFSILTSCKKFDLTDSNAESVFSDSLAGNKLAATVAATAAGMQIESTAGPVTASEIASFKSYMLARSFPANNWSPTNVWVYGQGGGALQGLGLMFEVTEDRILLDHMLQFADKAITCRNDILPAASGGQRVMWNGNIEPVWPNTSSTDQADAAQGDIVGHIAYAAKLILARPALWNLTVGSGDPNAYGATYRARALTYVARCEETAAYIKKYMVDSTDNKFYYTTLTGWTFFPGGALPWNQQMMLNNAFQRLAECHQILGDAPSKVTDYDQLVQTSLNWFLASAVSKTSASGTPVYFWNYAIHSVSTSPEDTPHGRYDVGGFFQAYLSGRYSVPLAAVQRFSNTVVDVMAHKESLGWPISGRIDGTNSNAGGYSFLHERYLPIAVRYNTDEWDYLVNADIASGEYSTNVWMTAHILSEKNYRYLNGIQSGVVFYQNTNYAGTASQSLPKGTYTLAQLAAKGVPNDWASSLRVPSGWKVTLYQSDNFAGTSWVQTADNASLVAVGANDSMSSCKIE
ncbi:hypothetical protein [Pedobacter sp. BMA]|uniref:hypothetical protein n=1 Tax=Pedobacter sp. BMA TaxID=1663685 RepID=UPI00064B28D7|nr:hypothetical protein [Pedobacter sp. BMA]KLT67435.1 hypothetical protein AB669_01700 [Pedobacter sp. BMA]